MGIHDGHRQRMKDRFTEVGLEGFNDHNALELLLFYAVGRKDTNELAHKLLRHFGSLPAVLEADYEELCAVEGIGQNTAVLLKLVPQISRRYAEQVAIPKKEIRSPEAAARYFTAKFMYETEELSYAMLLDNADRIIACKRISNGIVNATELAIRMLIEIAMKNKAASVIIAHNHPHGMPLPSREDEYCTELVRKALELVEIKLNDHIIVGESSFYSLKMNGLM